MASPLIEQILFLGDDQISSQFDIVFYKGLPNLPIDPKLLTFRVTEDFKIPEEKITYKEIYSRGTKIYKKVLREETDKRVSITFRVDSNWVGYNAFRKWFKDSYETRYGKANYKEKDIQTEFALIAKANGLGKSIFFKNVKLEGLEIATGFNHSSGDPTFFKADFNYLFKEEDIDLF